MNPLHVNDALALLTKASIQAACASPFGYTKLLHVIKYLDKQLQDYFAEAA